MLDLPILNNYIYTIQVKQINSVLYCKQEDISKENVYTALHHGVRVKTL